MGIKGILGIEKIGENFKVKTLYGDKEVKADEVLMDKCYFCKTSEFPEGTQTIGEAKALNFKKPDDFSDVKKLEAMTPDERFKFWRNELSKCIRCNACRNICPVCTCEKCVFDNDNSGIASKANANDFEEFYQIFLEEFFADLDRAYDYDDKYNREKAKDINYLSSVFFQTARFFYKFLYFRPQIVPPLLH